MSCSGGHRYQVAEMQQFVNEEEQLLVRYYLVCSRCGETMQKVEPVETEEDAF